MKKGKCVISFLFILFCAVIFVVYYLGYIPKLRNYDKQGQKEKEADTKEVYDIPKEKKIFWVNENTCDISKTLFQEDSVWQSYSTEGVDIKLLLNKNKRFILFNDSFNGSKDEGTWTYNTSDFYITLYFDKFSNEMIDFLKTEDISTDFSDSLVDYNIDNKFISIKLGYFQRFEDYNADGCIDTHFYINWFNNLLYYQKK